MAFILVTAVINSEYICSCYRSFTVVFRRGVVVAFRSLRFVKICYRRDLSNGGGVV